MNLLQFVCQFHEVAETEPELNEELVLGSNV